LVCIAETAQIITTITDNFTDILPVFLTILLDYAEQAIIIHFGNNIPNMGWNSRGVMSNINTINSETASRQLQANNASPRGKKPSEFITAPFLYLYSHLFSISVIAILLLGWNNRDNNYLSAENGAGYILGIAGGSLMLLLLLYPLSKRLSILSRMIPIRYWFGIHMLFGIVGPVMVLFHSNFHLGSTNSSIALISMLLVAGSGLVGRYIYTNIHHGLYGKRINLEELKHELANKHTELMRIYKMDEGLNKRLATMESKALQNYTGIMKSLVHASSLAIDAHRLQSKSMQFLKKRINSNTTTPAPNSKITKEFIKRYTTTLRRIAAFRVYERLFSLWHILHLPLFIMMIITAVIHIFAVHMY